MSLKYSSLLNSFVDWTDAEIAAGKKYLKWEEMTINWDNVDLLWEEVFILLEIVEKIRKGGSSGYGFKEYEEANPWKQLNKELGKEKTKKVIKIWSRVNGLEYDETREIEDEKTPKITINEFERFIRESIEIKIKANPN